MFEFILNIIYSILKHSYMCIEIVMAEEVTEAQESNLPRVGKEELIFESKNIVVFLETSGGRNDAPLVLAELGVDAQVINWSRQVALFDM